MMNYIVFQCYGNEGIFYECAYALLSLSRLYGQEGLNGAEVWIYTDNEAWFQGLGSTLPLHFRPVAKDTIKQWRGAIDFVHRVKLEILRDFARERNGNILYADTDTVFIQRLDKVFEDAGAGKLYMHTCEGIVSKNGNPILRKLNNYLRENVPVMINGKHIQDLAMWNAGVLAFPTKLRYLLDDALTFTDSEYPKFPKHVVEQFACSVGFQQVGAVKSAAPYIIHYWNLKEARTALGSFFTHFKGKSWEELVRYSAPLQMHVLVQEKVNFLQNRGIWGKLAKKQWQPPTYDWKEIEKQG